jgi:hypothetical protein
MTSFRDRLRARGGQDIGPAAVLTRGAVVWCLVAVLAVIAFEESLHSVHHASDQRRAAACAIAACSSHVAATPVEPVTARRPVPRVVDRDDTGRPLLAGLSPVPVDRGRAPPLSPR